MSSRIIFSLLFVCTSFLSCKKDPIEIEPVRSERTAEQVFYFRATINGFPKEVTYKRNQDENNFAFTERTVFHPTGKCVSPGNTINPKVGRTNIPATGFFYYCYDENVTPGETHFHSIFNIPNHSYYQRYFSDSTENLTDGGVMITWVDDAGKPWSTQLGPQPESWFTITYHKPAVTSDGCIREEVKAEFSCLLHDGEGNSITVTDGEYYLPYEMLFK